jgi:PPP family 3-phenylpropionic acid transporter
MRSAPARLSAYFAAYFLYVGAFVPYFSLYLASRGLGAPEIALVLAMPAVARILAPSYWGLLADRSGAGRAIVVFSGLALLLGYGAVLHAGGAGQLAAVMLFMSLLSAGAMPIVESMTMAAIEGRPERYGPVRLWGSVGFIAGVLGTGMWLDAHAPRSLIGVVLALVAIAWLVSLGLPSARASAGVPLGGAGLTGVLRRPDVLAFLAACACMAAAHGALYGFFSLYAEAVGYRKSVIGALWTLGVVAEIAVFMAWPRLAARFSLRALLVASFACAALRFAAIGWGIEVLALLVLAQVLHAATFGVYHAAAVSAVHRLFPAGLQASGQSLYSSLSYGLGGGAGTLAAGWAWQSFGAAACFSLASAFAVAGGALVAWRVRV